MIDSGLLLLILGCSALLWVAFAIYPGELSWLGTGLTKRLYDRAAPHYEKKWLRHNYQSYDDAIAGGLALADTSIDLDDLAMLDLCTGTGRAVVVALAQPKAPAKIDAVDFSSEMLARLRARLAQPLVDGVAEGSPPNHEGSVDGVGRYGASNVALHCADVARWLTSVEGRYGLVTLMEAGEFIPQFDEVMRAASRVIAPRGVLVLTYPAFPFGLFFPGRCQTPRALARLLSSLDFEEIEDVPWRRRYRIAIWQRRMVDNSAPVDGSGSPKA